jgi:hypothetical protein
LKAFRPGFFLCDLCERLASFAAKAFHREMQWRIFGADTSAGFSSVDTVLISNDGTAYTYRYNQLTSQAYVVTGLK